MPGAEVGGSPNVTTAPTAELSASEDPTNVTASGGLGNITFPAPHIREGIVLDKWPFRLDIALEYQDWILVAVCTMLLIVWCLPCICGRMRNPGSIKFTNWVYTRLHVFFTIVTYVSMFILMCTIGVLPDWSVNEFCDYLVLFISWVLVHLKKLITSLGILAGFYLLFRFRERIALFAGIEHVTVFRFHWKDIFGFGTKQRPVEIYIWKVEDLQSSTGKVLKANDVYVECHMGYNEPMRTRVHNNAGSACSIQESFQLNIDENAAGTLMTLLVKDQQLLTSTELARLMLSTRELCGIEDQTGKRRINFTYGEESFVPLNLLPRGKIWLAIAPVDDGDEERAPLMNEDALVTC